MRREREHVARVVGYAGMHRFRALWYVVWHVVVPRTTVVLSTQWLSDSVLSVYE